MAREKKKGRTKRKAERNRGKHKRLKRRSVWLEV
jgi:hypothetical protein